MSTNEKQGDGKDLSPPSTSKVREAVHDYVRSFAPKNMKTPVKDEHELKKAPLRLDDNSLNFLSMSLRGYVKQFKKENTILAKEVKKKGMKVGDLVKLVDGRVR